MSHFPSRLLTRADFLVLCLGSIGSCVHVDTTKQRTMAATGPGLRHLNGLYAADGKSSRGDAGPKLGTIVFPGHSEHELIDTIRAEVVDDATIVCSGFVAGRAVVSKTYWKGQDFNLADGVISLRTKSEGKLAGDAAGLGMAASLINSTIRILESGDLALRLSASSVGVVGFAPGAIIPLIGTEKHDFIYRRVRE